MSAKEKQVAQIFERTKWIIEQARQQCLLWEQHLSPKLLLHGILPPPWLSNSHHPKELNKDDDIVSEVLYSQPQFGVPFSGRHCSLYSNLGVVSEGVLCPSGLPDELHALRKGCNTADGHSNLPDCSVNNDGCASSGPPELDSGAISPRNQMEPRVSDSYHDLALSLAKLQRSKSRQKALELRCSAKASKRRSGDDNNAGICADTFTGPVSSILQADQIEEPDFVKDFHTNIQDGSIDELSRGDRQAQTNGNCNYSGRITRSVAQKLNSSNVASSSDVKEDGPPTSNLNAPVELVNGPLFIHENCEGKEPNLGDHQMKEAGNSAYRKRTRQSRSSSQSRYNGEVLKLDSTSGSGKGVDIHDSTQPFAPVELTDLSKASHNNNGSGRNIVNDSGFCNTKDGNSHSRTGSLGNSSPSPVDDVLNSGGRVKSINQSVQSLLPVISQRSQDRSESVVGSFHSQKNLDSGADKAKERLSRGGSGKACTTTVSKSQNHIEGVLKPLSSNFHEQSATCSESAYNKSQNVRLSELDARRLSSSQKTSKLDVDIALGSVEKENIAAPASRITRAVTTCANEGSLRAVSVSNLDGRSLPVKSKYTETIVDETVLDAQENIQSGANPGDNVGGRSTAAVVKVDADMGNLVEKNPSCLGSRLTRVSPNVGMDVLSSDFVVSVIPKQLDFDDIEESSMNGISSPDMKEGQQGISLEEIPMNLSEPVNVLDDNTSLECQAKCNFSEEMRLQETEEALIRHKGPQMEYCASHFNEASVTRKAVVAVSPNKELQLVPKETSVLTSLKNHSSAVQFAGENLSGSLAKEVMPLKFVSVSGDLENDETSAKLCDAISAAVTGNGLQKHTDKIDSNFTAGFSSGALVGEVNVDDERHSCPQRKRRKTKIDSQKFSLDSSNFQEMPLDSIDPRSGSRDLNTEEDNPHILQDDQHLTSNHEDDRECPCDGSSSPTEEVQDTLQCKTTEGSSLKMRKEEKQMDVKNTSAENLLLEDKKLDSWHVQVNGGQDSAQRLTCAEKSNSNRRIHQGGSAKLSDGSSVSPGIQRLDFVVTGDTVPEFEGFIMPTDDEEPCTTGDQVELERMDFLTNSVDYTSLGKSRFMHSPLCYSSTPYKLQNTPGLCQSLPNGLLEGMNMRNPLALNERTTRPLSDSLPNLKVQCTPSVQTLWDRINSNFGSSGKRQSLKPELPCISEENENMDEIVDTVQEGIASKEMTSSITRVPLADIIDNTNPSEPALQDDKLTEGGEDFLKAESNFSGTQSRVKKKLGKHEGNRRFKSKGKENQMSFTNGSKRTTESVGNMSNRASRPKLSGKDSLKVAKSSYNNIVSNVTSFIPLVQQKQAAAVATGKRDIKVKALEAAEAAKRMAEKKENERKMKKEAMRLERERLEQHNLKQQEQQKKKKEEERKKKEAEMAAKKRQREEEDKKEKERKKKRLNDAKKQHQEQEKIHNKKEEIQIHCRAEGEEIRESKKLSDGRGNHQDLLLQDIRECNLEQISETKESCPAYQEAVSDSGNKEEVIGNSIKAAEYNDIVGENSLQEQSYEISPYKESDDEDEDDDDIPNNKFIPSWASKQRLSLAVSSQKMDPETIFPPQSFCNIAEVLLPRKFRL